MVLHLHQKVLLFGGEEIRQFLCSVERLKQQHAWQCTLILTFGPLMLSAIALNIHHVPYREIRLC